MLAARDRKDAEGFAAIGAGNDSFHSWKLQCFRHVDIDYFGMGVGTAIDAPGQHAGRKQVGGIFCSAGDLFRPINHRNVASDIACRHDLIHGDAPAAWRSAANFTASMILTYPVQRQMLLPSAARISSSLGDGFRRNSPAEAMMNPG